MSRSGMLQRVNGDQQKQIDLLNNHVNKMKLQQDNIKRKNELLLKEANEALKLKLQKEQMKSNMKQQDQEQEEQMKRIRYANYLKSKQRSLEMEQVRKAVAEMKRNEYLSLSKMHDENEEKMKKLADSQLLENHKKKNRKQIKESETQAKENYKYFWISRLSNFDQTRSNRQLELQRSLEKNEKTLTKLEQQELDLLQSLKESKLYNKKAQQQAKDAKILTKQEYLLKYPDQP